MRAGTDKWNGIKNSKGNNYQNQETTLEWKKSFAAVQELRPRI
jgi:hypothetical protein